MLLVLSDPTFHTNRISSVIVRVFALNAVDLEFEPRSCQDSLNLYATLRRKSNDWVVRNQDNVSEWSGMCTRELLFQ
jgi:hypothetical protein